MEGWRERLHCPSIIEQLCQPKIATALQTAVDVLTPSLTKKEASSACVLLIGPPASGKSLLTRLLVNSLQKNTDHDVVVVPMTGLLHSTPARAWHHLADTLITWYQKSRRNSKTASSPAISTFEENGDDGEEDGSNVNRFQLAIEPALQHLRATGSAILLVLDQLHRFTTADPLSQTVLYSLFNLLQDRSLKAACIAQTTYLDVTNLLEKRVLSRLSDHKIVVPLVESSDEVIDFLTSAISPSSQGHPIRTRGRGRRSGKARIVGQPVDEKTVAVQTLAMELVRHKAFVNIVNAHLARSRVIAPILRAIDAAITMAASHDGQLPSRVEKALSIIQSSLTGGDSTLDTILSLTQLQLSLLVALRRLEGAKTMSKKDGDTSSVADKAGRTTFRDVFKEYCKLGQMDEGRMAERDLAQSIAERPVAERAWELLIENGIVVRTGTGPRDVRPVFCAVAIAQIDTALEKHPASSAVLKNWARRSIVVR